MKWTTQQERALDAAGRWLTEGDGPFRLFGYAGTGKTTLAKHLAAGVSGEVLYAAFTGKAAHVMRQSGCHNATTLHSLLYKPKEKSKARLLALRDKIERVETQIRQAQANCADPGSLEKTLERLKKELHQENQEAKQPMFQLNPDSPIGGASLLVVDEVSMVPEGMAHDILSFGTPVLCLGDPAQLPPVKGAGYFTKGAPDVMLTDVQRQARDNPILDLATRVRQREKIPAGQYGDSLVIDRDDFDRGAVHHEAMILVGKNKTRRRANEFYRGLRIEEASSGILCRRDRLVCLRNNHDEGLLNGALFTVEKVLDSDETEDTIDAIVRGDDGLDAYVSMHQAVLRGEELDYWVRKDAEEFDYGYALTVHKSQGSQWPEVVLIDESDVFRQDKSKWLYTGVTRAAEKITVVL